MLQGKSVCLPCNNDYTEGLEGKTEFLPSLKDCTNYTEVLEDRTEFLPRSLC